MLAKWADDLPRGLALVEYENGQARRLTAELLENSVPVVELELARESDPFECVQRICDVRDANPGKVLSVWGFEGAFGAGRSMAEAWGVFNFARERLFTEASVQIWWMTTRSMVSFAHWARDSFSWFLVRLRLTEQVLVGSGIPSSESFGTPTVVQSSFPWPPAMGDSPLSRSTQWLQGLLSPVALEPFREAEQRRPSWWFLRQEYPYARESSTNGEASMAYVSSHFSSRLQSGLWLQALQALRQAALGLRLTGQPQLLSVTLQEFLRAIHIRMESYNSGLLGGSTLDRLWEITFEQDNVPSFRSKDLAETWLELAKGRIYFGGLDEAWYGASEWADFEERKGSEPSPSVEKLRIQMRWFGRSGHYDPSLSSLFSEDPFFTSRASQSQNIADGGELDIYRCYLRGDTQALESFLNDVDRASRLFPFGLYRSGWIAALLAELYVTSGLFSDALRVLNGSRVRVEDPARARVMGSKAVRAATYELLAEAYRAIGGKIEEAGCLSKLVDMRRSILDDDGTSSMGLRDLAQALDDQFLVLSLTGDSAPNELLDERIALARQIVEIEAASPNALSILASALERRVQFAGGEDVTGLFPEARRLRRTAVGLWLDVADVLSGDLAAVDSEVHLAWHRRLDLKELREDWLGGQFPPQPAQIGDVDTHMGTLSIWRRLSKVLEQLAWALQDEGPVGESQELIAPRVEYVRRQRQAVRLRMAEVCWGLAIATFDSEPVYAGEMALQAACAFLDLADETDGEARMKLTDAAHAIAKEAWLEASGVSPERLFQTKSTDGHYDS